MVNVTLFNSNVLGMQVQVNNGAPFTVPGCQAPSFTPQGAAAGGPGWSYQGAAPNVLAPGENSVTLTPQGSVQPYNVTVSLPADLPWSSLQLFLFFNSYSSVTWVVLNEGQLVTANVESSQLAG